MLDVEDHTCPHGEWSWVKCSKCDSDKAERIRKLEKENAELRRLGIHGERWEP